jgi:murein DD-endopeptidase MepM/ murein hydrolase activator NlpD
MTCPHPWVYDSVNKVCKKAGTPPPNTDTTVPTPVAGPDGKMTCPPPWVYDSVNKVCKKAETPSNEQASIIWPLYDESRITQQFSKGHPGIDIGTKPEYGLPVKAPEDGKITVRKVEPLTAANTKAAGLYMKLLSTDGNREHIFMHLSRSKEEGLEFKKGDTIAWSGGIKAEYTKPDGTVIPKADDVRAGSSTGLHLHWGVKVKGVAVDPLTLPGLQK